MKQASCGPFARRGCVGLVLALAMVFALPATAQNDVQAQDPEPVIEVAADTTSDTDIKQRIEGIFAQIDSLSDVSVAVQQGVVILTGSVSNERFGERAAELAIRLEGVVTVEDRIERTLDVEGNVRPVVTQLRDDVDHWVRALPLVLLSLAVFGIIAFAAHLLASWSGLWQRLAPNSFLAALMSQLVRVVGFAAGLIVGLNLIGATALMGTILGSAGVIGLAIGFAVRDTLENYISSIMLSLRQPFRANDHVVIDSHEGKVVRLTSRATVLMTLDGNQLRIPNSMVFKAVILNYSRNPQRRFNFELGVDASDDPVAAMNVGLDAIAALDFVLQEPAPNAVIKAVGDSNTVLTFLAWVDQTQTSFGKARSLAIRAATTAIEDNGFTLPEPIYRLRFDGAVPGIAGTTAAAVTTVPSTPDAARSAPLDASQTDVSPDTEIEELINEERTQDAGEDLLDSSRPVE